MAASGASLSGLWVGSFAYPGGAGPTTPFLAWLEETDGRLGGTVIEPNTMGTSSRELDAVIRGTRSGTAVDFVKTYDGASDAAHAVDYVGRLSADGHRITGVWSLAHLDGTFEMSRASEIGEEEPDEAEVRRALTQSPEPIGTPV